MNAKDFYKLTDPKILFPMLFSLTNEELVELHYDYMGSDYSNYPEAMTTHLILEKAMIDRFTDGVLCGAIDPYFRYLTESD